MATFTVSSSDTLAVQKYSPVIYKASIEASSIMKRFMGTGMNNIIESKTELSGSQGDKIIFPFYYNLPDTLIDLGSGQAILGSERSLAAYAYTLTLTGGAVAVSTNTFLSKKRTAFDIVKENKDALAIELGRALDRTAVEMACLTPKSILYATSATAFATTTTESTATLAVETVGSLTPAVISAAKGIVSKMTGESDSHAILRPISINGSEYYVLLVHPDCLYDLKRSSEYTQAQREALARSNDHPLFKGADTTVWDGVIVIPHVRVPTATTWGAGGAVKGAKNVFMGAQALCWAWGLEPELSVHDVSGHGLELSIAYKFIYQVGRPQFNSKDYGSFGLYTSRGALSGLSVA